MPRPATGTVESYTWKDGRTVTWRLRVRAYGQRYRVELGTNHEGWSRERALVERDRIVAAVQRGTWQPPNDPRNEAVFRVETFHVLASRWWARRRGELTERTREDYRWRLDHLLRLIPHEEVATIDVALVDDVRARLLAKGLGARSTNMVLGLLAQVLDDAVDRELLAVNPARGRRRRVKQPPSRRAWLEPDMVIDLLDAAGEWERELPPHQRTGRRALLALLCLAGPRVGEALEVPRAALDLHAGALVLGSKTEAGVDRRLDLTAMLLGELRAHLAARQPDPAGLLFPTRSGGQASATWVRRMLREVERRANVRRADAGRMRLPHVTPHALRRTFASLAFMHGRDARYVMAQLGHADPRMTLAVYAQVMQRQRIDRELVAALMRFPDELVVPPVAGERSPQP